MSGDEMGCCRRHTSPTAGPLDNDDLLSEILIRLPALPSSLPRASLVCKRWRRLVTDASFLRLFRGRHRKPPILGVFRRGSEDGEIVFTSVLDPPDRIPAERFSLRLGGEAQSTWSVLGSRHGRVLIINWTLLQLILFHPVTGHRRSMAVPSGFADGGYLVHGGAVLCDAGDDQGHLHGGDCQSSPFKVVLVGSTFDGRRHPAVAAVYSSDTGMWGDLVMTAEPCTGCVTCHPCTIIGNAIYWCLNGSGDGILEFDLDKHSLTVIDRPPVAPVPSNSWIIRGEDAAVGLALLSHPDFELWDRKVNHHGATTWVLRKTADMNLMFGPKFANADIVGYDEDTDAILMSVDRDPYSRILIIVQLESMRVKECRGSFLKYLYIPFTNFFTAGTIRA